MWEGHPRRAPLFPSCGALVPLHPTSPHLMAECTVAKKTCQGKNPVFLKGNSVPRPGDDGLGQGWVRPTPDGGVGGSSWGRKPPLGQAQRLRKRISVVTLNPGLPPGSVRAWSARVLRVTWTRRTALGFVVGAPASSKYANASARTPLMTGWPPPPVSRRRMSLSRRQTTVSLEPAMTRSWFLSTGSTRRGGAATEIA